MYVYVCKYEVIRTHTNLWVTRGRGDEWRRRGEKGREGVRSNLNKHVMKKIR